MSNSKDDYNEKNIEVMDNYLIQLNDSIKKDLKK